ncbi:MAG: peptidoglycan DD-metalloendopeptidase family protein [Chloroflexi bacterium]|nr:peptidoglycan DD-metalloendopeptidase family protein [Chloroflexota bacterium]
MLQNSVDLDSALTKRLADFNAITGNPIEYQVVGQTADDSGAIIYLKPVAVNGEAYIGVVDWAVALHIDALWNVFLPGDPGYTAAYNQLPADLLSRASSAPYTPHANPALTVNAVDYQFPWDDSTWATVTRSYNVHGTGRIDFDLSGRDVTAAKDGTIIYANDTHSTNAYASVAWWYWNTIVIQHADHEFSLYGHLAQASIPQSIKDACSADLSVANCAVPVKAGQIIAQEGSTGYSSNPHLHLEFGQAFAVASYMDVLDEDRDGNRVEAVPAAYLYLEQNVPISGYTAAQVAAWPFGTLQQAAHLAPPPANVNLIRNGDFSAGTDGWTPSGQLNWSVQKGALRFTRLRTTAPPHWAFFYQDIDSGIDANTPFESTLQLGNTSGIAKTITVSVFNRSGKQYGSFECVFSIPPNTSLTMYTIRAMTVNTWASLRYAISVNPPDGSPAALADDISLTYRPDLQLSETQCIAPP